VACTYLSKVLGYAVVVLSLLTLSGCVPTPIDGCQSTAEIHVICGLTKPEDLAHVAGTPWLLVSELGNNSVPGQVVAFDPTNDRLIRLKASNPVVADPNGFPICGTPPISIRPRGFHVRTDDNGKTILLLVNVAQDVRIERYAIDTSAEQPQLRWEGCVAVPSHLNPNDVAALHGDGFVISHMFTPPMSTWLRTQMFVGVKTGYVARWTPQSGWDKVQNSEVSFANGIETSPQTDRIFVAATYGETLTAVNVDGSDKRVTQLPIQPDNLTWSADGLLIAVGHTGVAMLGTNGCRDMVDQSCAFPFAVAAIDPQRLEVEVIYTHDEGLIPGPSVALWHEEFLFLGTFFGDRVSRVRDRQD
jgi:hypothetical protein